MQKIASIALNDKGEKVIKIPYQWDINDIYLSDKIESLPGWHYHIEEKAYSAPVLTEVIRKLKNFGYSFDDKLLRYIELLEKRKKEISEGKIQGLKGTLMPFQSEAVAFIEEKKGRCLIADQPGLGKTIESLAWLLLHPDKKPVIVVVPKSAKLNWKKEAEAWMPDPKVQILSTTTITEITGEIVIINYDILHYWLQELKKINTEILILDEAHKIKSNATKRTKAVKKLAKKIPNIICLTGTPIENKPVEIYNILHLIDENIFPSFQKFAREYCNPQWNGYGWDYSGASHLDKLNRILTGTVMLRRLKNDVLKDLPGKTYSYVPIEIDNRKEYHEAEKNFIEFVRKTKGEETAERISEVEELAKTEILKQVAVKGKLSQAIEWIKDFIETDEKLVVFATHKFVIERLMTEFSEIAVKIDGSVTAKQRQTAVDDFQKNNKIRLFVGNIQAASECITLTVANNLVFLELPWSPKSIEQASDRIHRITQERKVIIYYLLAEKTIEEKIARIIDRKTVTIDAAIDGKDVEQQNLLHELMREYKNNCLI
jgi:SWI/SNF-related matrix-associated actin-dependent regulator of chromatin subfamily A-like protein 1